MLPFCYTLAPRKKEGHRGEGGIHKNHPPFLQDSVTVGVKDTAYPPPSLPHHLPLALPQDPTKERKPFAQPGNKR